MDRTKNKLLGAASILGGLFIATPAQAQALEDDFWIQLSGFFANVDTDLRIAPAANPGGGTELDLEADLELDDSEFLPSFFAGARLGSGFSIGAEYYSVGRDSSATLGRTITVNDVTYPAGSVATANFDTDIYRLTVGWAFIRNESVEVGAAIGFHGASFDFGITGQGTTGGGAAVTTQTRATEFLAPLPTVGLFATFQLAPGLTAGARLDFLSLSIGDYDGRLINTQASISYRFFRNFGAGVAYRYVDYRVDVEKTNFVGRFAYEYSGPLIFLEVGF